MLRPRQNQGTTLCVDQETLDWDQENTEKTDHVDTKMKTHHVETNAKSKVNQAKTKNKESVEGVGLY